jgi:hypothetical protein
MLLALCGCRERSTSIAENWVVIIAARGNPLVLGGSFIRQENKISGILHASESRCFDALADDLVVTGTLNGQTVTFNIAPVRGQTISVSARFSNATGFQSLSGTYTSTGSKCTADSGTVTGLLVQPMTGTFKGQITGGLKADVIATLKQTGPDEHGFFHLSGDFAFSGSPCFSSGKIVSSNVRGADADFLLDTSDGGQTEVHTASSPIPGPELPVGTILTVKSGSCVGKDGHGGLTKQ